MITKITATILFLFTISGLKAAEVERKIEITKQYLNLPVQESQERQQMTITAKGKAPRTFVIRLSKDHPDYWVFSDVSEFIGQTITITYPQQVEGFSDIYQSDQIQGAENIYKEKNRPQFHFTSQVGWNNDPNGLVYYKGKYHLFYQHNPYEANWENMHWGHAVSTDLLHWEELPDALFPDEMGIMASGSAAVDVDNSSGFQKGNEKTIIAAYTGYGPDKQVQCIAFSNDAGMTWTKYEGNPLIDSKEKWNSIHTRDPKIFWHDESQKWVMVLFEKTGHSIYNSDDLKNWSYQSHVPGFWECPELFELAVDGEERNKKWVMYGASGTYMIGDFDGKTFTPESGKHTYFSGKMYAAQTYNNIPQSDGRRIQMAWGQIEHPGMRFTQMMVFPTELTLRNTRNGVRLYSQPISEVEQLHKRSYQWSDLSMEQANSNLKTVDGDLFRIEMDVEILNGFKFRFDYNGNPLVNYTMNKNLLNGSYYAGDADGLTLSLEILVDRTSAEVFADSGRFSIISQLEEPLNDNGLEFYNQSPDMKDQIIVHNLEVHELNSIW